MEKGARRSGRQTVNEVEGEEEEDEEKKFEEGK